MSKLLALTVAAAGLHGGLAQTSSSLSSNLDGCVTDFNATAGVDYFPDKAVVEFAETFSVEYFPTYKVLTVQAEGFNTTTYVLYQCGTPVPTLDEEVQEYISVPVTTVSTGTPDHIPRIELLGHRDSIVAYTGDVDRIGSPCVDALVEDGTVEQALVFDTREECQTDAIDNEALIAAGVEVAFGDSLETSWCLGEPVENGVQVLLYAEGGETIGLGHGEGIKFFSLFYNEEAKGNELFEEIETKWFCTKDNAAGCSLQLAESPTVAWFSYTPTDPAFGNAGSGWGAPDNDTYYAQAVSNTGGTLLYCGSFEWYELWNDEQMLDCFADADVCVFGDDYAEVERFFNASALESLACVQNERVYDITLSGINAWFEAVNVEPHVLMEDMVVALHGEDADFGIGTYERLLLRHYHTEESDSGSYYPDVGTCTDPDAVLELQGECEIILDFDAVCDGTVTADGQDSPASSVLPGRLSSALATVFVAAAAAAASLW